ncbi:MAG TPA: dihydrolipoamide acetyltransferase family protein [Chloroflexota bacterium]|nr:dihydrolipoamide acetyltransferase family protein [Chloroflexota bacterium]
MAVEVKLPKLAASMDDGVISKWLKAVGESVKKGEPLFEVESDKVTTEVEAPVDGILQRIVVPEGEKIDVGTVLAVIAGREETVPETNGGGSHAASAAITGSVAVASPSSVLAAPPATKIFVTPRARKVADELGVDLNRVKGTGPGGRILERDVLAVGPSTTAPSPEVVPPPVVPVAPPVATPVAASTPLPLAGMRRVIAERMVRSQQTVAEVTLTQEADVGEVMKLREQVSAEWQKQHGFKVSPTDVIIKAVARALREHPRLNSSLTDAGIQDHAEVNVGVAVALDEGLIVPVIRNADQKSLLDIAKNVRDLSERARKNQLGRDDLTGGTFTVTNMGMLGVEAFTPIINWPECAILGVGRIADRAVVRDGQVVARPTLWLSLTFDHRIVDGAPAAVFLSRVRQLLESPYLLFV